MTEFAIVVAGITSTLGRTGDVQMVRADVMEWIERQNAQETQRKGEP